MQEGYQNAVRLHARFTVNSGTHSTAEYMKQGKVAVSGETVQDKLHLPRLISKRSTHATHVFQALKIDRQRYLQFYRHVKEITMGHILQLKLEQMMISVSGTPLFPNCR
jgi:ABC-type iron transport system FetAB ATPase subunit